MDYEFAVHFQFLSCKSFYNFYMLVSFSVELSHYGILDVFAMNFCKDQHQSMFMSATLVLSVHYMRYLLP